MAVALNKPQPTSPQNDVNRLAGQARKAAEGRDWDEALRCWNTARALSQDHVPAFLGAAVALRESGRLNDAAALLDEATERFPDHEFVAITRAWLANARREWPEAIRRWADIRARFPDNPISYLGSVAAFQGAGETDPIEGLLDRAASAIGAATLTPSATRRLEFKVARARPDWAAVRRLGDEILADGEAVPSEILSSLAQACWHLGDGDAADEAAQRAIARNPDIAEPVLVRAWVATDRGDGSTAIACYRRLVELEPGTARWSLKLVQLLNWHGQIRETVAELERLNRLWPNDPMVRLYLRNYGPAAAVAEDGSGHGARAELDHPSEAELRVLIEKAPNPAGRKRTIADADPEHDVIVAKVDGASTALLVFTGSNDAVGMPLPVFDPYLAPLYATTVYLKDFNRLRYLAGIRSLGTDYAETLLALRQLIAELGVTRLCTIGNCDGGFAAIRYGVELGADRVLAFSAPTRSPACTQSKIEQARNFMRNRLDGRVSVEMMDLRAFLETRQYDGQIEFFYDEHDQRDVVHADHLSGLPAVKLTRLAGASNQTLLRKLALTSDDFFGELGALLGVGREAGI